MSSVPEKDWKVFEELHSVALERMCERVLKEARGVMDAAEKNSTERYWDLNEFVRKQEKEIREAFDDCRRSTARLQILLIESKGLWTEEEIGRFSEETRGQIARMRALRAEDVSEAAGLRPRRRELPRCCEMNIAMIEYYDKVSSP